MVYSSENAGCSALSNNKSVAALENTLHQSINHLKELVIEFDQLQLESDECKTQVLTLKGKCESKVCIGSEALKKVIELKDNIIQSVASALTRLNETKDMSIIDEAFKILCGETVSLTPPKDSTDIQLKTPKKEMSPSFTEPIHDESVSEIEGTPTGRTSPIIVSRKTRNAASDYREKKKCPDNWPTPKNKAVKLTYTNFCTPTSNGKGKLRQTRFTTVRQTSVLDISSSPEFVGLRGSNNTKSMQLNIKKESLDDEDTIEPSPTSITSNFSSIYRSTMKSSPLKLNKNSPNKITKGSPAKLSLVKKPHSNISKLLIKTEGSSNEENVENKLKSSEKIKMEDSINLLRPPRFLTPDRTPAKLRDPNETECNIDSSMSLLHRVNKLEKVSPDHKNICSPTKRPLVENINLTNLQTQCDTEASISLLNTNHFIDQIQKDPEQHKNSTFQESKSDVEKKTNAFESIKKKDLERMDPKRESEKVDVVFKEPTVRKKAEKRALPGWFCDECKQFYAELYKDDPVMLAEKMEACSKHRGRQNPVRPKTPPGFWYPRWEVPEDTEEFNRRNNAA